MARQSKQSQARQRAVFLAAARVSDHLTRATDMYGYDSVQRQRYSSLFQKRYAECFPARKAPAA